VNAPGGIPLGNGDLLKNPEIETSKIFLIYIIKHHRK
jgi:hypothetical protein